MKTSHLQSMQARIAALITFYHAEAHEHRVNACQIRKAFQGTNEEDKAEMLAAKKQEHKYADTYIKTISKLVPIQKAIKQELRHG